MQTFGHSKLKENGHVLKKDLEEAARRKKRTKHSRKYYYKPPLDLDLQRRPECVGVSPVSKQGAPAQASHQPHSSSCALTLQFSLSALKLKTSDVFDYLPTSLNQLSFARKMSPPNQYEFQNRNSVNIPTSLQSGHCDGQLVHESPAVASADKLTSLAAKYQHQHQQQAPHSAQAQAQAKNCTIASTYAIDENDSFQFGFSNLRNIESDSQSSKFIRTKTKKQKLRDYLDIKGVKCNNPNKANNVCYSVNDQFGSESLKKNVPVHINSLRIKSKADNCNNSSSSSSSSATRSNDKREDTAPR